MFSTSDGEIAPHPTHAGDLIGPARVRTLSSTRRMPASLVARWNGAPLARNAEIDRAIGSN